MRLPSDHEYSVTASAKQSQSIGLAFQSLRVHALTKRTDYQKTFGNFPLALFSALVDRFTQRYQSRIDILNGCDGLVRSGETLLVLGRPGSGCSTLLKTLAGETLGLHVDKASILNYQGIPAASMHSRLRGECSYQAELDVHFPTLTTTETVLIPTVARMQKVSSSTTGQKRHIEQAANEVLQNLGLGHRAETKVGNDTIPGISGGERKRLSIAEVLACASSFQCWDNSTRGLDSENATKFVSMLRRETKQHSSTAVVSLYQASQEIYNLFDKVLLLYQGREVFFGETKSAQAYFERLGFLCPERQSTADFLTSLTNPPQRIIKPGYEESSPKIASEFEEMWLVSKERSQLLNDIQTFRKEYPLTTESWKRFQKRNLPYTISVSQQIKLCTNRGFRRLKNDLAPPISGILGNCIISIILGTVFLNLPETTGSFFGRSALLFFATLLNAFVSGFEPGMLWEQRPIVEKHFRYALYHPASDAIASMICDLPYKIAHSIFFNVPLYFITNLRRTASAFLTFWLFSFACLLTMSMIFRSIGSWCSTLEGSMAPAALFILLLMIYTGFTLPIPYMRPWLRWFNYINPLGYAFESLMISEFSDRTFSCSSFIPEGPEYREIPFSMKTCSATGATPGQLEVSGDAYISANFQYKSSHLWRNFGIIIGIMLFACGLHLLGATYATVKKSKGEVLIFKRNKMIHDNQAAEELGGKSKAAPIQELTTHLGKEDEDEIENKVTFLWDELSYEIKVKKAKQKLIDDVEGWIQPKTLTALMGESGAGKTTLLNVLANRISTGVVHGSTLMDPQFAGEGFARKIGYAQQEDIHLPTATVREALEFSALLRQPNKYSKQQKLDYVEEVIASLEMEDFADVIIGVPGEGLNVEQRKRLTIGIELSVRPELLLFLDEPTSGLDSSTAWVICSLLRKLANQGQTILCTIHQPSIGLFQMFDKLLLLKQGKSIYCGDIGRESEVVIKYFENHGAPIYAEDRNPAEWLLNITSTPASKDGPDWATLWKESPQRQQLKRSISEIKENLHKIQEGDSRRMEFARPFGAQLVIVLMRHFSHFWRTPSYLWSKAALCIGSFSPNSIQGIQNQIFAVFLLMTIFTNLDQQIIPQFTRYRELFESREGPSRSYSWVVFLMASIIVEIPWQTLMSLFLFVCWYYPIGMHQNGIPTGDVSERSALVFLFIWSFMLFTLSLAFLIIAGMESGPTAVNIAQLLYSLSLIFCGVLATPSTLPRFWVFMYRVTPLTYLVGGLLSTTLGAIPVACSASEAISINLPPPTSQGVSVPRLCEEYLGPFIQSSGGHLMSRNESLGGLQCLFCPVSDTKGILKALEINYSDRWWQFGVSIVYIVFNFVGAFALYWVCRARKRGKT